MTNTIHNLDTNAKDYFKFILGGVTYQFRYPTTKEINDAKDLLNDETKPEKILDWLVKFISRIDGQKSDFVTVYNEMNIPMIKAFNEMIKLEIYGNN